MPVHPWGASRPEMNAGVIETGSTQATWMAASAAWTMLADAAMVSMGIVGAQMFASTTSISGIRSMVHEAATPPFLAWLATMAGIAAKQAAVTEIVAGSYGMTRSSMIPSVQAITNRVNERAAEATNFFGQNSPLIAELNTEYAEYTAQNAALGTTYGEVITAATLPTPIPPPPPLGSLAKTAGESAASLGDAASQIGQAPQGLSQAASQSGDMSQMSQMFQAPMQAAQSAGQSLGQGPQGLSQLLQGPAQMFGQVSSLGSLLNGGSTGDSFSPALGATSGGGLPLGAHSGLGSGAGSGAGVGSGAGAGSGLGNLARSGASPSSAKSAVLSGVSPAQEKLATSTSSGGTGRGGMMPAHMGGNSGASSRGRREEGIVTVAANPPIPSRREAKGDERELFN